MSNTSKSIVVQQAFAQKLGFYLGLASKVVVT
jgi:hypothetical protein